MVDCQDQLPAEIKKEFQSQPPEGSKVDCQDQPHEEIKNECQLQTRQGILVECQDQPPEDIKEECLEKSGAEDSQLKTAQVPKVKYLCLFFCKHITKCDLLFSFLLVLTFKIDIYRRTARLRLHHL